MGCFILSLVACSSGTASTKSIPPTGTAQTKTSSLAKGTVLYQADWSHGLSGWHGSQAWKAMQGQLQTDSNATVSITAPYKPTVTNYAIEIRIQVVRLLQKNGGNFSIFAEPAPGKDGYKAGVSALKGSGPHSPFSNPQAQATIDPMSSMEQGTFMPVDYDPHSDWHTYSVEVQGSQVSLLVDGTSVSNANSIKSAFLSNGPIGLSSAMVVLRVSNFRITAL